LFLPVVVFVGVPLQPDPSIYVGLGVLLHFDLVPEPDILVPVNRRHDDIWLGGQLQLVAAPCCVHHILWVLTIGGPDWDLIEVLSDPQTKCAEKKSTSLMMTKCAEKKSTSLMMTKCAEKKSTSLMMTKCAAVEMCLIWWRSAPCSCNALGNSEEFPSPAPWCPTAHCRTGTGSLSAGLMTGEPAVSWGAPVY
jgi:hypothetical protein